jgi:hypothetical protein
MPIINTTTGPQEAPRGTRSHINTSDILEPPLMTYEGEEPEIISVLPGTGWQAVIGEERVPLVAFVALDSGKMHGVVVGADGCIDLTAGNVEELAGFTRYEQTNINDKE